ncbi:MAG: RNA-directed DNA polymerase [Cryobacterium sp.]|nr:RNA-directed DNA polymerase [Cryobacterium sp.]
MTVNGDDDDDWITELLEAESLNASYATKAFLQQQYLPNVKKNGEELPPIFSSATFSTEAAEVVRAQQPKYAAWVELRTRRFDGLVRRLGIPHPVPYSKLVLHIRDHWNALESKLDGTHSQIKPSWHGDGRVIQMDYVEHMEAHGRHTRLSQGKHYLAKADISSCFPSIYSHALDWAMRGKTSAKSWAAARPRPASWEADLDLFSRNCMNQETKGLLIGPAVSNLLSELVLQRVDEALTRYSFVRYIDDYSAYFDTREQAEDFIVELQKALAVYRLDINTRKTKIVSLREGVGDAWMAEVLSHLPSDQSDLAAARFLQQAELLAQKYPTESVLKFAAKTLLGREEHTDRSSLLILDELVRITQFHPHLLPVLGHEINKFGPFEADERERLATILRNQLLGAIRRAETDSILWLLYILRSQLKRPLKMKLADFQALLDLNDDLVWVAVSVLARNRADAVEEYLRLLAYVDEADRQSHWLARYEFWRVGRLQDVDMSTEELGWMRELQSKSVEFSDLYPF